MVMVVKVGATAQDGGPNLPAPKYSRTNSSTEAVKSRTPQSIITMQSRKTSNKRKPWYLLIPEK